MEKSLDLSLPGVMELGREELKSVDGGWLWFVVGLGTTILFDAILSGQEPVDALMDGWNSV
jgi:hypothetical protein